MLAAKLIVPPVSVNVAEPVVAEIALLTKMVFELDDPVEIDTLVPPFSEALIALAKIVLVAPAVNVAE